MTDALVSIVFLLPLVLMTINFCYSLWLRSNCKEIYADKDYSTQPTVSILLPVFNEGSHVMETIKSIYESDYPLDRLQVIAQDDCSKDDSYEWLEKAKGVYPNLVIGKNPHNQGKHHTLSNALRKSSGEVLVCIDSDCIFHASAVKEMVACLVADPTLGAVGGRVKIANVNENAITKTQTVIYSTAFLLFKAVQNQTRSVFCISGCLFAIRREIFLKCEPEVTNRQWLGVEVKDGEDAHLTRLILKEGYRTYMDLDAMCSTHVPATWKQIFVQQVRWRRSGMRGFFWTLYRPVTHFKRYTGWQAFQLVMPGLMAIAWPLMIALAVMSNSSPIWMQITAVYYASAYLVMGLVHNHYSKKTGNADQVIDNIWVMPLAGLYLLVDSLLITSYAILSFDSGNWGTRAETQAQSLTSSTLDTVSPTLD